MRLRADRRSRVIAIAVADDDNDGAANGTVDEVQVPHQADVVADALLADDEGIRLIDFSLFEVTTVMRP